MRRPAVIIIGIVIALALAGAAFWGGMSVGKAQAQNEQNNFFASRGFDPNNLPAGGFGGAGGLAGGTGGQGQGGARGAGARGAAGTIQKVEGNTVTIQDNQGNTVTVTITDSTPIVKTVSGSKSDLVAGKRIVVQGSRSGNNVAATGIQITDLPAGMQSIFGGGGGARGPRATPTPGK